MTNKNNRVHAHVNENGGFVAPRVHDFVTINSPEFLGSKTNEDTQNFLDEIKNIFERKENRGEKAAHITWDCFSETFLDRFSPMVLREAKSHEFMNLRQGNMTVQENAMLLTDMNIDRLMTHAQQVEGDKLRQQAKENKKARTGNYDYSQQKSGGGNRSQGQQKFSAQAPSSVSVPSFKNRYEERCRELDSKSQGSVSGTKTYPTFPTCGKKHPGECLAEKEGCFGCGQSGHMLRDCPSRQGQRGANGRAQSTTSAAPASRPTQQGNSSGKGGGQR
ncbi:uncharacterized protein [Solanum lycopersicum]|uniref:uncharacterized protein n=1 Tax=Solanum lycopersicum TaxID=4081 RepID=UPI003747B62A